MAVDKELLKKLQDEFGDSLRKSLEATENDPEAQAEAKRITDSLPTLSTTGTQAIIIPRRKPRERRQPWSTPKSSGYRSISDLRRRTAD